MRTACIGTKREFGGARWPYAIVITLAPMYFSYDGFMWRVRKNEV